MQTTLKFICLTNQSKIQEANNLINIDLHNLFDIPEKYCLSINPTKAQVMVFGPKYVRDRSLQHIEIKVDNEIINKSDLCKILGLYTDHNLRFDTYVNHIIKRAFSNFRLIYANSEILNTKVKVILCEGLVFHI